MSKEVKRGLSIFSLSLIVMFATAITVNASDSAHARSGMEHPEGGGGGMEHPMEGMEGMGGMMAFKVDKATMAQAITEYINEDTKLKGGYFLFYDSKAQKPLALTLTKVHDDRLAQVGENLYFACTDFKEAGGTMYDLDFFMKSHGKKLQVTEVMLHKEADKPRYTWHEKDGMWMRMPTK